MHTMLLQVEDGSWRVLVDQGDAFQTQGDALDAIVKGLPHDAPSPLIVDRCAQPDRVAAPIVHHFDTPPPPKEAKAKNLRVGYGVWAEGAPAPSRIHKVSREHPDHPGQVVAFVEWGRIVYDPDEIVKVDAPVLHPRIVDDKNVEIGLGSPISGGPEPDGEVIEIVEPDMSHWGVAVKWPQFDEPERFEASPGRRNRKRFQIIVRKGTSARGQETSRSRAQVEAEATAAGVKKAIRQMRPQEAGKLERVDLEIAAIEAALTEARDRRQEVVREAWRNGHVVRVADLRDRAIAFEAELEARKADS